MPITTPSLILASGSPRRKQLLEQAGLLFEVIPTGADESHPEGAVPTAIPELLARRKAAVLAPQYPDRLIVAADTVVILDHQLIEKPADAAEAEAMLARQSGRTQTVVSGICLAYQGRQHSFSETTLVHFREVAAADIAWYVANYQPLDKAGAYGIQEWIGLVGVQGITGCYYNVMGLPVSRLMVELRSFLGQ